MALPLNWLDEGDEQAISTSLSSTSTREKRVASANPPLRVKGTAVSSEEEPPSKRTRGTQDIVSLPSSFGWDLVDWTKEAEELIPFRKRRRESEIGSFSTRRDSKTESLDSRTETVTSRPTTETIQIRAPSMAASASSTSEPISIRRLSKPIPEAPIPRVPLEPIATSSARGWPSHPSSLPNLVVQFREVLVLDRLAASKWFHVADYEPYLGPSSPTQLDLYWRKDFYLKQKDCLLNWPPASSGEWCSSAVKSLLVRDRPHPVVSAVLTCGPNRERLGELGAIPGWSDWAARQNLGNNHAQKSPWPQPEPMLKLLEWMYQRTGLTEEHIGWILEEAPLPILGLVRMFWDFDRFRHLVEQLWSDLYRFVLEEQAQIQDGDVALALATYLCDPVRGQARRQRFFAHADGNLRHNNPWQDQLAQGLTGISRLSKWEERTMDYHR